MCEGEYNPQRKYEKRKSLIIGIGVTVLLIIAIIIDLTIFYYEYLPISTVEAQGVKYERGIFRDYYRVVDCDESWLEIDISSKIKGKPVKVITTQAFSRCKCIKSITLPNSIEIIEGQAFKDCESLNSLTIPKSVKKIGGRLYEIVSENVYDELGNFLWERSGIQYKGSKEEFRQIELEYGPWELRDVSYNSLQYDYRSFYIVCQGNKNKYGEI